MCHIELDSWLFGSSLGLLSLLTLAKGVIDLSANLFHVDDLVLFARRYDRFGWVLLRLQYCLDELLLHLVGEGVANF
jgi:hypothetical protein